VKFVKIGAQFLLDQLEETADGLILRSLPDLAAEDFASLTRRYGVDLIVEKIEHERQVVDVLDAAAQRLTRRVLGRSPRTPRH
jgi:cyclic-di-GMP phosphodiesterase TipF (flagellum assembly factor)